MNAVKMKNFWLIVSIPLAISCSDNKTAPDGQVVSDTSNVIPLDEAEINLFDGATLNGWHSYNHPNQEIKNWVVLDSALVCLGNTKPTDNGDLASNFEYANFDLSWDWKIDPGANSGVLYHVTEAPNYKSATETGPEYQLIDDIGFPERLEEWQKTGADYAMHIASAIKKVKGVGEWNSSRIIYNNGHVEHWLNGNKIVSFDTGTADWEKRKMDSKWKDYPDYGKPKTGKIVLQDHGKKVYFKNIVIKEL